MSYLNDLHPYKDPGAWGYRLTQRVDHRDVIVVVDQHLHSGCVMGARHVLVLLDV